MCSLEIYNKDWIILYYSPTIATQNSLHERDVYNHYFAVRFRILILWSSKYKGGGVEYESLMCYIILGYTLLMLTYWEKKIIL